MSQFLFSKPAPIPELSEAANDVIAIAAMCERLVSEKRTRTIHEDGSRENVAEHSLMLVKVAVRLAEKYFPELDRGKVAVFAADHDDIEAYVGDTPTDSKAEFSVDDKRSLEARGLQKLTEEYGSSIPHYVADVADYESQDLPEARFVRMVDKVIVATTHFFNDGKVFKEDYSFNDFVNFEIERANNWQRDYPEFAEVIAIRTELTMYLARKYLKQ